MADDPRAPRVSRLFRDRIGVESDTAISDGLTVLAAGGTTAGVVST